MLPVAWSVSVTEAPATSAPLESFTTPRSEVVAVWPNAKGTMERMQQSIHPERDFFTAAPQKIVTESCDLRFSCTAERTPTSNTSCRLGNGRPAGKRTQGKLGLVGRRPPWGSDEPFKVNQDGQGDSGKIAKNELHSILSEIHVSFKTKVVMPVFAGSGPRVVPSPLVYSSGTYVDSPGHHSCFNPGHGGRGQRARAGGRVGEAGGCSPAARLGSGLAAQDGCGPGGDCRNQKSFAVERADPQRFRCGMAGPPLPCRWRCSALSAHR